MFAPVIPSWKRIVSEWDTVSGAESRALELVTEPAPEQGDPEPLFTVLAEDNSGANDGIQDAANLQADRKPQNVTDELTAYLAKRGGARG